MLYPFPALLVCILPLQASAWSLIPHRSTPEHLSLREAHGPFTINSTGEVAGRLGIEQHGLGKVIFAEHRPIDDFILNGNILIAVDRNGSCYVSPETAHFHCEDVPDEIPHSATRFAMANNGTIVFNGTANWWTCPAQNPGTYDVYYQAKKPSPYCKYAQLAIGGAKPAKRYETVGIKSTANMAQHVATIHEAIGLDLQDVTANQNKHNYDVVKVDPRALRQQCPFVLNIVPDVIEAKGDSYPKIGPFIISGKSLMTSHNYNNYCFIEDGSRRLLCQEKSSQVLAKNWHEIKFSLSTDDNLKHDSSDVWLVCNDVRGTLIGPFDSVKDLSQVCASLPRTVQLKAQFPEKIEMCNNAEWAPPKGTKSLPVAFSDKAELRKRQTTTPQPSCPTNLVDTLFKSPSIVVPISLTNMTAPPSSTSNFEVSPTLSAAFNFFIPFTKPYYGKTCSLLLLLPDVKSLSVADRSFRAALQVSLLDAPVDETTTRNTLPNGRVLGTRRFPQDIIVGEDNSLLTFPCDAGKTIGILVTSKSGLSLAARQEGVPNECGFHIVPCA